MSPLKQLYLSVAGFLSQAEKSIYTRQDVYYMDKKLVIKPIRTCVAVTDRKCALFLSLFDHFFQLYNVITLSVSVPNKAQIKKLLFIC